MEANDACSLARGADGFCRANRCTRRRSNPNCCATRLELSCESSPSVQTSQSRRKRLRPLVEIPVSPFANMSNRNARRRVSRFATKALRAMGASSPCSRFSSMIVSVAHQIRVQISARKISSRIGSVAFQKRPGWKGWSLENLHRSHSFSRRDHSFDRARDRTQNSSARHASAFTSCETSGAWNWVAETASSTRRQACISLSRNTTPKTLRCLVDVSDFWIFRVS